ncbi:MAG: type II toxin-antitoxin system VapC family toxin [Acidimicrobiales bacterium]
MAERLVLDASAAVELLLQTSNGASVVGRLRGHELHAPAALDARVASGIANLRQLGLVSETDAAARLKVLAKAPIERHDVAPLLEEAWTLHRSIWVLDAIYLVLAERLGARVITCDARLARTSRLAELV